MLETVQVIWTRNSTCWVACNEQTLWKHGRLLIYSYSQYCNQYDLTVRLYSFSYCNGRRWICVKRYKSAISGFKPLRRPKFDLILFEGNAATFFKDRETKAVTRNLCLEASDHSVGPNSEKDCKFRRSGDTISVASVGCKKRLLCLTRLHLSKFSRSFYHPTANYFHSSKIRFGNFKPHTAAQRNPSPWFAPSPLFTERG